jgi:hypothetical protein
MCVSDGRCFFFRRWVHALRRGACAFASSFLRSLPCCPTCLFLCVLWLGDQVRYCVVGTLPVVPSIFNDSVTCMREGGRMPKGWSQRPADIGHSSPRSAGQAKDVLKRSDTMCTVRPLDMSPRRAGKVGSPMGCPLFQFCPFPLPFAVSLRCTRS